jgi:ATP-binding protein involved in chromosome partitioning
MKIAIPTSDGLLCPHFGHCQEFTFIEADQETNKITDTTIEVPPPHEPGILPKWLAEKKCNLIIAGGMGQMAITLFNQAGITVICGAPSDAPEKLVQSYLDKQLTTGENACDSAGDGHGGGCNSH